MRKASSLISSLSNCCITFASNQRNLSRVHLHFTRYHLSLAAYERTTLMLVERTERIKPHAHVKGRGRKISQDVAQEAQESDLSLQSSSASLFSLPYEEISLDVADKLAPAEEARYCFCHRVHFFFPFLMSRFRVTHSVDFRRYRMVRWWLAIAMTVRTNGSTWNALD